MCQNEGRVCAFAKLEIDVKYCSRKAGRDQCACERVRSIVTLNALAFLSVWTVGWLWLTSVTIGPRLYESSWTSTHIIDFDKSSRTWTASLGQRQLFIVANTSSIWVNCHSIEITLRRESNAACRLLKITVVAGAYIVDWWRILWTRLAYSSCFRNRHTITNTSRNTIDSRDNRVDRARTQIGDRIINLCSDIAHTSRRG